MKEEVSPQKNLEILSHYIIDSYNSAPGKAIGSIQFHLKHQGESISCYLSANGEQMTFNFGELENYDVKLTAGHYDWLDLAARRLNPVIGVIIKKLQFEGDTKVFDKLIKSNSLYKIDADISDDPTIFEKKPIQNWSRPEKVMVILGSPRGRNGYTFHYLNRFIKGLETGSASVEIVELAKKKVNPCTGCFHCWKNSTGRCIQNDDVNDIYDKFHESDMIIYAFTLYWDTVPGILKNFIERAFCLEHPYMIPGLYKTRHPRIKKYEDRKFLKFWKMLFFDSLVRRLKFVYFASVRCSIKESFPSLLLLHRC